MAKKEKTPLTPEQVEIKAMKKKRSSERTLKFFAVLLALVLTIGTVGAGNYMAGKIAPEEATKSGGGQSTQQEQEPVDRFGTEDVTDNNNSGDNTTDGDKTDGDKTDGTTDTKITNAEAIKMINEASKAATEAKSYMLDRVSDFTTPVTLDSKLMESAANTALNTFADGQSLDDVVGSLFGRGTHQGYTHTKGKTGDESFMKDGYGIWNCEKYMIKAMTLTEADLKSDVVDKGNGVYVFKLKDCVDPEKDESNALHHFTTDFAAPSEVDKSLSDSTGGVGKLGDETTIKYYDIQFQATIKDGKLMELQVYFMMDARADLKVLASIKGNGQAKTESKYYNFVY